MPECTKPEEPIPRLSPEEYQSLRFIPLDVHENEGYREYLRVFKPKDQE